MLSNITGIILAGGRSTRMGKDKALLPLPGTQQGATFVEHLVSTLAPYCSEILLVARDNTQAGDYANTLADNIHIVTDKVPGVGPLMGLYSGLSAMSALRPSSPRTLVVAVDMPFVQPALISFLISQPATNALLIPVVQNVPQVLLAIYPRTVLPHIEECMRQGRRDPRSLLEVAPVQYIEEEQLRQVDPQLRSFINVNTPEELEHLL
jgi:molybdopterin-guanine dinucleotide biosynthesis protein A